MYAVFELINSVFNIYGVFLLIYVILSLLNAFGIINMHQQFIRSVMQFLHAIIEPLAAPIRRAIHRIIPNLGGFDLSILVLWLLVRFVQTFINTTVAPIFL